MREKCLSLGICIPQVLAILSSVHSQTLSLTFCLPDVSQPKRRKTIQLRLCLSDGSSQMMSSLMCVTVGDTCPPPLPPWHHPQSCHHHHGSSGSLREARTRRNRGHWGERIKTFLPFPLLSQRLGPSPLRPTEVSPWLYWTSDPALH